MKASTRTSATFRNSIGAGVSDLPGSSAALDSRSGRRFEEQYARFPSARPHQGFTLLELVVVLVLAGLLVALAVPGVDRLRGSIVKSTERDHILDQFAALGRQAMLHGRTFVVLSTTVDASDRDSALPVESDHLSEARTVHFPSMERFEPHPIDLPDGWEIELDAPLVVRANGVCLGAGLILRHLGVVDVRVDLEPPYCRVDA